MGPAKGNERRRKVTTNEAAALTFA